MEIFERINFLIKKQHLTKREFAQRLIALEPKLRTTGETPTEKTIYKYLNGSIAIRIELIPYIAQALNIIEQELFLTSAKDKMNFYRKIIQNATDEELEILKKKLLTKYKLDDITRKDKKNIVTDSKKEQLIDLLNYAPSPLVDSLLLKLEEIKEFTEYVNNQN